MNWNELRATDPFERAGQKSGPSRRAASFQLPFAQHSDDGVDTGGESLRRSQRLGIVIGVAGLAMLAFIGYIKAAPIIASAPVDLTFVGAAIVVTAVIPTFHQILKMKGIPPLFVLYVGLLAGAVPVGSSTDYSSAKVVQVILLLPLCLLGGRIILRTERARRLWLWVIVALGGVIAVLTWAFPDDAAAQSGRLVIEEGNAIGSARGVGAAITVLTIWILYERRRRVVGILAVVSLVGLLLLIGSRGPILAAAVAISAAVLLSRQPGKPVRLLLAVLGIGAAGWVAISQAGRLSGRLFTMRDDSSDVRLQLWGETLAIARDHPLGIGWGQLYAHLNPWVSVDSGVRIYPHNLILEIMVEGGWATAAVVLAVICYALVAQWRATVTVTETSMFALFVFALVSAMVSGDLPSNREVWVAAGAAMVWVGRKKRVPAPQVR